MGYSFEMVSDFRGLEIEAGDFELTLDLCKDVLEELRFWQDYLAPRLIEELSIKAEKIKHHHNEESSCWPCFKHEDDYELAILTNEVLGQGIAIYALGNNRMHESAEHYQQRILASIETIEKILKESFSDHLVPRVKFYYHPGITNTKMDEDWWDTGMCLSYIAIMDMNNVSGRTN